MSSGVSIWHQTSMQFWEMLLLNLVIPVDTSGFLNQETIFVQAATSSYSLRKWSMIARQAGLALKTTSEAT